MKESKIKRVSGRIVFKLKHWEGVTLFKIIEQSGFERGCGNIFIGSNGWKTVSSTSPFIKGDNKVIFIRGRYKDYDEEIATIKDEDKSIYNNILETFKELSEQGNNEEPKLGDTVLVRKNMDTSWLERIYIATLPKKVNRKYITVNINSIKAFKSGNNFDIVRWRYMKTLKNKGSFKHLDKETFEVTFSV